MTREMIKSPRQKGHEEYLYIRNRRREAAAKQQFSREAVDAPGKRKSEEYGHPESRYV